MSRRLVLGWVGVLAALAAVLVVATVDDGAAPTPAERAQALYGRFACPECQGQAVSESNAPVSIEIRRFIDEQVAAGRRDDEIEAALVQAYDTKVLLVPPSQGFGALAWVLPVVGFTAGAIALAWVLTRDRGRLPTEPSAEDRALVEQARAGRAR